MASTVGSRYESTSRKATNALLEIRSFGFSPRRVRVMNTSNNVMLEWNEQLSAGHGLKTVADGTRSVITSAGISPVAANSTQPAGLSLGAAADVNDTTTENLIIEAWS